MPRKSQPTTREAAILGILLNGERFGREIRDEYDKRTGDAMPVGSLHVTLVRMEEAGFIRSRDGEPGSERNSHRRRCFRLTAAGQRALDSVVALFGALGMREVVRE